MGRDVSAAHAATNKQVVCVLADEQRHSYRSELAQLERPGLEFLFEDSPEDAIDLVGQCGPDIVLVGMTVGMMEGLEVLALLMQKHPTFAGKVIVLPDKGDPFPPVMQYRDPVTGKSTTESLDFAGVEALIRELAPAPAPPVAAVAAPPVAAVAPPPVAAVAAPPVAPAKAPRDKAPPIPMRSKPRHAPPIPREDPPSIAPPVVATPPSPSLAEEMSSPVAPRDEGATNLAALVEQSLAEPAAAAPTNQEVVAAVAPPAARVEPPVIAHVPPKRSRVLLFAAAALGAAALVFLVLFATLRTGSGAPGSEAAKAPPAKTAASTARKATPKPKAETAPVSAPPPAARPKSDARDLSQLTTLPLAFSKRSADYSIVNRNQLAELTKAMSGALNADPQARLEIGGHSSEEGAEWLNLELSERRATAVRSYLVTRGIPPERMVSKSYGSSVPSETSSTDPESDRRVTVRVVAPGTEAEP